MSASTIARWNAIPMKRESDAAPSNKRSRSNDDDDSSDDDVSLVSRSPSPQSGRDVHMKDTDMYDYDEHVSGVVREVVTVETKIKSSNKGFAMLAKMGWTEGTPLGLSGEGRIDPIPFTMKQDATGLGKVTQDFRMIETTVSQRRNLDSERMRFETLEQRQQREAAAAQKAAIQSEISHVLRPFYCEICDKQFRNVAQYDEHTNSYAHHHKARARDMNANHPVRAGGREEVERRKEKERKREERELRKLAKAAGIKLSAPPVALTSLSMSSSGESKGFKKSGWSSVGEASTASSSSLPVSVPSTISGGWTPVSGSLPPAPIDPPPPPPLSDSAPVPPTTSIHKGFRSGGWSTLSTSSVEASLSSKSRDAWTNLSTALPLPPPSAPSGPPPPPPEPSPPLPPTPPSSTARSWSCLPPPPSSTLTLSTGSNLDPRTGANQASNAPPPQLDQVAVEPNVDPSPDARRKAKPKAKSKPDIDGETAAQSRGNWQSFQKMRGRR